LTRVPCIIRQYDNIGFLVTELATKEILNVVDVINTTFELSPLLEIINPNTESLLLPGTLRVLE